MIAITLSMVWFLYYQVTRRERDIHQGVVFGDGESSQGKRRTKVRDEDNIS